MPRLDNFLGFQIKPSKSQPFNPFSAEIHAEPNRSEDVVGRPLPQPKSYENLLDASASASISVSVSSSQKTYENLLDATALPPSDDTVIPLFPMPRKSAEPIAGASEEAETKSVPMIQPRDKDGQRLLYKHPNLPRVGVKGAYWLLVGQSDRSQAAWLMQFDGAANPNPGPASSGAVLWSPPDLDGRRTPVFEMGKYLGKATNNIAEVQGLLLGLKIAAMRGARELLIEGDSELIIFQQTGKYRVSDKKLKVWWSEIQAAMMDETCFDWIAIRQVRREFNERADSITQEVLGRKEGFQR
jgi:ribonuclease HI